MSLKEKVLYILDNFNRLSMVKIAKQKRKKNVEKKPTWNDDDWIVLKESKPKDEEEVYLKCEYMMYEYITIGRLKDNQRLSADCDLDLFFRSKILAWKPL